MLPITIILIFVAYVLGTRLARRFGDRIVGPLPDGLREFDTAPLTPLDAKSRRRDQPRNWLMCVPGVVVVLVVFTVCRRGGLAFEPMVVLLPLLMTAVTIAVRLREQHLARHDALRRIIALGGRRECPDCGYDLEHGESERCPECGRVV